MPTSISLPYNNTEIAGLIIFKVKDKTDKRKFYQNPTNKYNESIDEHIFFQASGRIISENSHIFNISLCLWM